MTNTCEEDYNLHKLLTAPEDHKLSESPESSDPENVSDNAKFDDDLFDSETSPDTSGKYAFSLDIPVDTAHSAKEGLKGYLEPINSEVKGFGDP